MYFTERKKWADEGIYIMENKTLRWKERGSMFVFYFHVIPCNGLILIRIAKFMLSSLFTFFAHLHAA